MKFPPTYAVLKQNEFTLANYRLIPIRFEDRTLIKKWRNEQIYHLRQSHILSDENQTRYFENIISKLFENEKPDQLLFSFLKNNECIGYGGLVHINWIDRHAEISFVMDTSLENTSFSENWNIYLSLIEQVAFEQMNFHKLFTYAYDLRPHLYDAIEKADYTKEAVLKEHCFYNNEFKDVVIHSKIRVNELSLRSVKKEDALLLFDWVNDSEVRTNAFNNEEIVWEDHNRWFQSKLNTENTKIFLLLNESIPVGQIRFDLESDNWLIDYSISNKNRGKGFGKKIVQMALSQFDKNSRFIAKVKLENIPSQQVFKATGFEIIDHDDKIVTFSRIK